MKILKLTLIGDELFYAKAWINFMYHVCIHVILFQSVNKFPFPNKTALKYIHTFVTRTSMIAFDHNFNRQG